MFRLKELRKDANITMKKFGEIIGVSESTISLYESGKRQPDYNTLERIADHFNVTVDYLLGRDQLPHPKPIASGVKIPVLGIVQAGVPMEAIENIIDYEEISEEMARSGEYFGLRVKGSSMEPKFSEGDVVIVRKQPDAENGEIAIILVNGSEATIKKIKKDSNGIMLIPSNPNYEVQFYDNKDIEEKPVQIIGKVVELRAKF